MANARVSVSNQILQSQTVVRTGATITTSYTSLLTLTNPASIIVPFNGTDVTLGLSFDGVTNHLILPIGAGLAFEFVLNASAWPQGIVYVKSLTIAGAAGSLFGNFFF